MISMEDGKAADAFYAALHAAWACDDACDGANAVTSAEKYLLTLK